MYRMPEKQTWSQNAWKWFWIALEIVCKLPILSIKLIYPGFFATFQFASFPYILFLWKLSDSSCEFTLSKGRNITTYIYNHGNTCLFRLTYTYMQITLHSADFAGDKNVAFDFSDACLFFHPIYFDYHDFLSFTHRLSFQRFNAGREML